MGGVTESLRSLEAQARQLDTSPRELSEWLDRLRRFSVEFLAANAHGPAFHGEGAGPPARTPLPLAGASFESVLEEYREAVQTRSLVTTSGRFFGYVPGGALPSAAVAEYVAALTNPYASVYGASPGATQIENSTVAWLIEMIGYPAGAWGTLQSGGSLATLAAIVAAREARPQADRARGVAYMTDECHLAVRKALHIAGLGDLPVRAVAVDDRLRMSVADLERKIAEDQEQGLLPWLVFASAGTVNTGAVDPLDEIAAVARGAGLWLHVDAAYGGFFILTERAHALLAGMAQADSVVLDPHKGLFLPSGCGAVLVRDGGALRKGFAFTSSYLSDVHAGADLSPTDYSPELTRHFRALRLWMSLKLHGVEPFKAALEEKLLLARLAHERLSAMRAIETAPEPELSCVAFRVRGEGDRATEQMLDRVLERGRVQMSSTRLRGRLYVRMCILCFRSHLSDVEEALAEIAKAVARVAALPAPGGAMKRVTGIGGIFFKSKDPKALGAWYKTHLGIDVHPEWGGAAFDWKGPDNPEGVGTTAWSLFPADTKHFAPSGAPFMVNYRVADLHGLLAALRSEGVQVEEKVQDSEYGKFGWVVDPEGNKIELWQPPDGQ